MANHECPEPGCGYNSNMRTYDADIASTLNLTSTRSRTSVDAHRDYDHFDVNEELTRLRRAVHEIKLILARGQRVPDHKLWHDDTGRRNDPPDQGLNHTVDTLTFIAEAFDNIDENLLRQGPLPKSWQDSLPRQAAELKDE